MITYFEYCGYRFEVLEGEYRRYRNHSKEPEHSEYLCVAKYNGNRLLLQYVGTEDETVDFVETLFSRLPEFAFDYLMSVLDKYENILVRATYVSMEDAIASYEIYYDCDCLRDDIDSVLGWMISHNDFASETYRYTEIVNGHQKCVGEKLDSVDETTETKTIEVKTIYDIKNVKCPNTEYQSDLYKYQLKAGYKPYHNSLFVNGLVLENTEAGQKVTRQAMRFLQREHILSQRDTSEYVLLTANGVDVQKSVDTYVKSKAIKIDLGKMLNEICDNGFVFPREHNDRFTGNAIASPFVAMSRDYMKQVNATWFAIHQIVKENCSVDYGGATPHDDLMERLLTARRGNN